MSQAIELPLWLFVLIVLFATVTFASHFLFPSVRWFFRRRLERAVARLNTRLERPIQPFKLARRHDMIQRLIYDPQVGHAVQAHAQSEGVPEAVAFEEAKRYAREIVPSFSAFAYFSFAIRLARFLSNAFYHVRLSHLDENTLRNIDPKATVVFVMNHRSNMDYVLITYLAAQRSALSYAVGEWARVWPLSRLIRAMGAYFIRRKSGSELYRQVLASYVRHATDAGVTQAMFPEGGLSLTGALGRPKLGLLKYIVDGADPDGRDVVFVPVALNYDRVLEDTTLTAAAHRNERRFRARIGVVMLWIVKQLFRRIVGRYHRLGYAAVSFGDPVSLKGFRAENEGDVTIPLARHLMANIGEIIPVLPIPLIAWLVLRDNMAISRNALERQMEAVAAGLASNGIHLSADAFIEALDSSLMQLKQREVLIEEQDMFRANPQRVDLLRYYAESVDDTLKQIT
ncbi:glycerol-3-phosphate acyltransferase [Phaeobacter gallaeciensis]|uniref:Glycerol-3-phosphate acyltransferase n=2 Tax=Roseobacteraceae TaxID=2854170 RepID=A0A366WM07_9RHOB|nr:MULTISPECIES: 1-acyl-sn-glycerol-3-phosphate acyltransferase [Roseobacteraceae]MBT3141521.1 1-acyl-sn-glycerol-3-phosphate acyltransferase [Falsiruegeria litorea]MBT8167337.1 1-acyl-sn-glycerol-3-phosphate acyltransferase [Falsiruegeria litorea]RBW50910.1 glycerol-3-phosphate acyltransferase [Phaeobacter gallaeciensis]